MHCTIEEGENDPISLPLPIRDEDGTWNGTDVDMIETTKAEYLDEILALLEESGIDFTILEALGMLSVCPAGFVDPLAMELIALESDASTYHILPSGKGILDEPLLVVEGFRAVRRARDDFYLWRARRKK